MCSHLPWCMYCALMKCFCWTVCHGNNVCISILCEACTYICVRLCLHVSLTYEHVCMCMCNVLCICNYLCVHNYVYVCMTCIVEILCFYNYVHTCMWCVRVNVDNFQMITNLLNPLNNSVSKSSRSFTLMQKGW